MRAYGLYGLLQNLWENARGSKDLPADRNCPARPGTAWVGQHYVSSAKGDHMSEWEQRRTRPAVASAAEAWSIEFDNLVGA